MNCDPPATKSPSTSKATGEPVNQAAILAEKKKAQDAAEQRQFQDDLKNLKGQIKGADVSNPSEMTLKMPAAPAEPPLALKPVIPVPSSGLRVAWTPQQCEVAQQRVTAYRQSLRQTAEVAQRLSRTIASDQGLRSEWEETMTTAVERAKDRGQFLWLALPLGKLQRINDLASEGLEKNAGDLADLLASTTDPHKRNSIRIARQFNVREKDIVADLGKKYSNIDTALTLGGNAPLMLEDPGESPTSIFQENGMKLRETGEMLFGLIVERDNWKRLAANAPLAKHLAGGLSTVFAAETAARAMFDSWYDAFATGLAWEQINAMNMNAEQYLMAVQKLNVEMRKRGDRLKKAETEFARECSRK